MANLSSSIIPIKKGSAIVKSNKFFNASKQKQPKVSQKTTKVGKTNQNILHSIEKKVIKIDKLLKNSLLFQKKESERKRKQRVGKSFADKEKDLEKNKPKQEKGPKLPEKPKLGLFDTIRNYIGNVIFGFFAVRLIDFLPKLLELVPTIVSVGDFIIDMSGKLLDGIVTFVDWGYKAIDGTRQFIKNIGGEGWAQNFDKFAGAIDNLIEIAIITSLAVSDSGSRGDPLDSIGDFFKEKGAQKAAQTAGQQVAGTASRGAGLGAGAVAGIVAGAGLLSSALGEGAFQVRKFATKPIQDFEKKYNEDKNPLTKFGRGIILNMMRPLYGVFSTVGFLLDVVGAPFRYAIELLRFPFLSEEDKQKQAKNLAKFDSRIREDLRKALNMVTLGLAFKEKGSFGNIYGNKGAQKEMMSKMASGGQASTRGGKPVNSSRKRRIKKKAIRIVKVKPQGVKPGASIGGEDNIKKLFPEASKTEKEKTVNPYNYLKSSSNRFTKSGNFGALFSLVTKAQLGQKPSKVDYQNAAQGLMAWMQTTFSNQIMRSGGAFAEGGEVNASMFNYDQDMKNVIAKSVQDSVAPKIDDTINDLMKQLDLKPREVRKEKEVTEPSPGEELGNATEMVGGARLFMSLGFPPLAAAILAGNIQAESQWKGQRTPWVLNDGAGTNKGLISWNRSRITNAEKFLGKPLETASNAEQVKWIKEELGQYGLLDEFMNPQSTEDQLKRASYKYIGWGIEGDRWKYSSQIYASIQKGEKGSYVPSTSTSLGTGSGNLSLAKNLAESMGLQVTSAFRPGDPGYHGKNRAMDFQTIGAPGNTGTPSQLAFAQKMIAQYGSNLTQLIYTPLGFGISNGKQVPLSFWGDKTNSEHYHHVHVAFAKGGRVSKPTRALIGETGTEFIFDPDTTKGLDSLAPGLLEQLNVAKTKSQLASILQTYADYEMPYSQPDTVIINNEQGAEYTPSEPQPILMGGGSVNSDNQFEDSLMYG